MCDKKWQTETAFDKYIERLRKDLALMDMINEENDEEKKIELIKQMTYEDVEEWADFDEYIDRHWECLEVNTFIEQWKDDKIIDVLLWFWWPNIRLRLETKRDSAVLSYSRGFENFKFAHFSDDETNMLFQLYDYSF